MVGVSDPEFRQDRRSGWQFIGGLAVGYLAASLLLGSVLGGLALLVHAIGGHDVLRMLLVVAIIGFAIADLTGRTPHANRQVPQRFVREVAPLPRGLAWGFDLGLLVTTQKTASLIWVGLLGLVLLGPASGVLPALLVSGACYLGGVTALSLLGASQMTALDYGQRLIPVMQRSSGGLLLGVALLGLIG